jgi:hypothetical protein
VKFQITRRFYDFAKNQLLFPRTAKPENSECPRSAIAAISRGFVFFVRSFVLLVLKGLFNTEATKEAQDHEGLLQAARFFTLPSSLGTC